MVFSPVSNQYKAKIAQTCVSNKYFIDGGSLGSGNEITTALV